MRYMPLFLMVAGGIYAQRISQPCAERRDR